MRTRIEDNYYLAGMDLLHQDYLAAVSELNFASGLSKPQLDLLCTELAEEHKLRCAQEWRAIGYQMRADLEV